jgi:hypothetical protein
VGLLIHLVHLVRQPWRNTPACPLPNRFAQQEAQRRPNRLTENRYAEPGRQPVHVRQPDLEGRGRQRQHHPAKEDGNDAKKAGWPSPSKPIDNCHGGHLDPGRRHLHTLSPRARVEWVGGAR